MELHSVVTERPLDVALVVPPRPREVAELMAHGKARRVRLDVSHLRQRQLRAPCGGTRIAGSCEPFRDEGLADVPQLGIDVHGGIAVEHRSSRTATEELDEPDACLAELEYQEEEAELQRERRQQQDTAPCDWRVAIGTKGMQCDEAQPHEACEHGDEEPPHRRQIQGEQDRRQKHRDRRP